MPFHLVRNDITKMPVDVIVNSTNKRMTPSGSGVNAMIHKAAGAALLAECQKLGTCERGEARITQGYALKSKYVIHTVGPVWHGGFLNEENILYKCYENSLNLAKAYKCESIAFPLIASGTFGYPKDKALRVATNAISDFLLNNDMNVYIVVFDKAAFKISEKLFSDIEEYIDDNYTEQYKERRVRREDDYFPSAILQRANIIPCASASMQLEEVPLAQGKAMSLEEALGSIDESFTDMLLRKIDEMGMKDSECYKKANIDRKLFSKIRKDKFYKPAKTTAIAFAVALELPLSETEDMLKKAGYALSKSNKFDIIIEYFISHGNYNIFEINEVLFAFDQSLLGY